MSIHTVSRLLLASILAFPLACVAKPALGPHHGRGSHGGGGSRSGGGRSHSGGGGGFHGGRRLFGGKSHGRGWSSAPRQRSAGSYRGFGGLGARPRSNSAFFAGRGDGWNRASRAPSVSRTWSGQRQSTWASTPRSPSSFNSNRPPFASSASRGWSGQGRSSLASRPRSTSSFNSDRPPFASSASSGWSGQGQSSWASLSRSTLSFNPNRRQSNFGNSRFGNSSFGRSSFSNSRTASSVRQFGRSRFRGAHRFDSGANSFDRESSFGAGDFSFFPDLFGLALDLGGFGLRGLTLVGSGLGGFGVPGLGLLGPGLSLLDSSLTGFNLNAGLESRQCGPDSAFYSTQNLSCPQ
jgi:hypothetical protein